MKKFALMGMVFSIALIAYGGPQLTPIGSDRALVARCDVYDIKDRPNSKLVEKKTVLNSAGSVVDLDDGKKVRITFGGSQSLELSFFDSENNRLAVSNSYFSLVSDYHTRLQLVSGDLSAICTTAYVDVPPQYNSWSKRSEFIDYLNNNEVEYFRSKK